MAWNEWESLKSAKAVASPGAGTGGGGGARGDLVAHQDDLGAVGHEAFVLHRSLSRQADVSGAGLDRSGACSTSQAAASLKSHHFAMGPALGTTVTVWTAQLKHLLQACAHISNHLDHTKASHAQDDAKVRTKIRGVVAPETPVSRLTEYFK
ncbi:hypothetical protein ACQPZG_27185 [Streptomyces sp. CA-294286]|uniref:hypothetical protein n=1 Tax=Streptomyces sp. CA-294286 TaxID=3240070 RepID=UPI003D8A4237